MSAASPSTVIMHGIAADRYLPENSIAAAFEAFSELNPVCSTTIVTALFGSIVQNIRQGYTLAIQSHEAIVRDLETSLAFSDLRRTTQESARDRDQRDLSRARDDIRSISVDLANANSARDRDQKDLSRARDDIRSISADLANARSAFLELQTARDRDQQDLSRARDDIRSTSVDLANTRSALLESQTARDRDQQDLSRVRDVIRSTSVDLANTRSALLESQTAHHKTLFEFNQVRFELNQVRPELNQVRCELKQAKYELEQAKYQLEQEKYQLDDKNGQLELMKLTVSAVLRLEINRIENSSDQCHGSVSRSALWNTHVNLPGNQTSVVLNSFDLPAFDESAPLQEKRNKLLARKFPKEADMYEPFVDYLSDFLAEIPSSKCGKSFQCFNTSKNYYLENFAPDITISVPDVAVPDAMAMSIFFEMKPQPDTTNPETATLGTAKNLGQVLEYLLAAARCQDSRQSFAGILSNLHTNIVVLLLRSGQNVHLRQYIAVDLVQVLRFVKLALATTEYQPPQLAFSDVLRPLLKRLGHPTHSIVGEFRSHVQLPPDIPAPPVLGRTMAVKRSKETGVDALNREIYFLTRIVRGGGPNTLPRLIYISEDREEIGICPVGESLTAASLTFGVVARQVVSDVLSALKWLHDHYIIHCDVRSDNVLITADGHGLLIDFDCSADALVPTLYKGGYICAPQEVWNNQQMMYTPRPSHDYLAVVLMVNSLLFPHLYKHFHSKEVFTPGSVEVVRLKGLWDDMKASVVWSKWVSAAVSEDMKTLEEMTGVLVLL